MINIDELFKEVKNVQGVAGAVKAVMADHERRIAALEEKRGPGRPKQDDKAA